jgi:hypothetical protein
MRTRGPDDDEIEVSVFGPGMGEAIALHLGMKRWVLIDSCLDPRTGSPASLSYLRDLDIDPASQVRLVVATHWHADHIRGIGEVFKQCDSANVVISAALHKDEFLKLVELYANRTMMRSSGMEEFTQIFETLQQRRQGPVRFNPPILAGADRRLYAETIETPGAAPVEASIYSLSPSDAACLKAKLAFAELLPAPSQAKRRIVASPKSNHASVVLWIQIGAHKILLGADLETTSDAKTGWSVIVSDSQSISSRADIFKIPHHGSQNGYHGGVWNELLSAQPHAVVTPFASGKKPLPTDADIERITGLTRNAFATAPTKRGRYKQRNRVAKRLIAQATANVYDVHARWGQVRFRRRISATAPWDTELFGNAHQLSSVPS